MPPEVSVVTYQGNSQLTIYRFISTVNSAVRRKSARNGYKITTKMCLLAFTVKKVMLEEIDRERWSSSLLLIELVKGIEQVTIEDEGEGKSDRTFVKDKSAKLEAKLERENKKKMVTRE